MGTCTICHRESDCISDVLALCAACVLSDTQHARDRAAAVHSQLRRPFQLPGQPPNAKQGVRCRRCVNSCSFEAGQIGFCGVRHNDGEGLCGGDAHAAAVRWYHDPLPTNCVADWVCPASGPAGYPAFTDSIGPEFGHFNLAVFYEACSFDCLFCQNWSFKRHSVQGPRHGAAALASAVIPETRCICFFGGDPSCQVDHALAAARMARAERGSAVLRICWETNGAASRPALEEMAELSLESGGCIKFDLKAWDDSLHRGLCGVPNRRTLDNFGFLSSWIARRPDPPLLVASTLLVPGYIGAEQVGKIARFIARLSPDIPYALLAFHPDFEMRDLPATSRRQATDCLAVAEDAGLTRVRLGNIHLFS